MPQRLQGTKEHKVGTNAGFTQRRYDARFAKIFCHKGAMALIAPNGFKNKNPDGVLYIKNILYLLCKLEAYFINKTKEYKWN